MKFLLWYWSHCGPVISLPLLQVLCHIYPRTSWRQEQFKLNFLCLDWYHNLSTRSLLCLQKITGSASISTITKSLLWGHIHDSWKFPLHHWSFHYTKFLPHHWNAPSSIHLSQYSLPRLLWILLVSSFTCPKSTLEICSISYFQWDPCIHLEHSLLLSSLSLLTVASFFFTL